MKRVLLLMGTETYRATDFLQAARKLGVDVVVGTDAPDPLAGLNPGGLISLDFQDREGATRRIVDYHGAMPLDALVSVDDSATALAARAAARNSSSVAWGFPKSRFSRIVPWNRNTS